MLPYLDVGNFIAIPWYFAATRQYSMLHLGEERHWRVYYVVRFQELCTIPLMTYHKWCYFTFDIVTDALVCYLCNYISKWLRIINHKPRLLHLSSVTWLAGDVEEPTHIPQIVGYWVPSVVVWLCLTDWFFTVGLIQLNAHFPLGQNCPQSSYPPSLTPPPQGKEYPRLYHCRLNLLWLGVWFPQ